MSSEFIKQTYDPKLGYEKPENAGSFLNNYLLDNNLFKEELNKTPETKVGTITPQDIDLVRRDDELYGPYTQYSPERYY